MKVNIIKKSFYLILILTTFLSSCKWNNPYDEDDIPPTDLVLKSGNFTSDIGDVFIQANLKTWLSLSSPSGKEIDAAFWDFAGASYFGVGIIYETNIIGEIPVEVEAYFTDGTSTKKTFKLISVRDMGEGDPVHIFVTNVVGSRGEITILLSKERVATATKREFFYSGSVSNWITRKIVETNYDYRIIDGVPTISTDGGQYIGVNLTLEVGEHSIGFIYGDNIWANLVGSRFVRPSQNPGLVYFFFDGVDAIALGDGQFLHPGVSGDMFFRFSNNGDNTATFFFKLTEDVTINSFVATRNPNGSYSAPIALSIDPTFPTWGSYTTPISSIPRPIVYFRYGSNKNAPLIYSTNMVLSSFYNEVYNALRLSTAEI